jgi:CHAD domain-containing protein
LIATLELTRSISKHEDIVKLQRRFKKVLKSIGPLRDAQVQLKGISQVRLAGPIVDFQRSLQRRARRQMEGISKNLKPGMKDDLTDGVSEVRSEFIRLHDKLGPQRLSAAVERVLRSRRSQYAKTRKQFRPQDEETLHQMRIALKKLRYAAEAAVPILGEDTSERTDKMHELQTLLGDTRDLELLRTDWRNGRPNAERRLRSYRLWRLFKKNSRLCCRRSKKPPRHWMHYIAETR